jgi:hypothetical protein
MPRALRTTRRFGFALVAVTIVTALSTTAALAAPGSRAHPESAAVVVGSRTLSHGGGAKAEATPDGAYNNCFAGFYCDWATTDGSGGANAACILAYASISNWGADGNSCRNIDESFANRVGAGLPDNDGLVRLYYLPNYEGAWACVDNGWFSNNLNQQAYNFDNGPSGDAGSGQEIYDNVASSQVDSYSTCSNPLPEDG